MKDCALPMRTLSDVDMSKWASVALPTALILIAEAFFFVGDLEDTMYVHALNVFLCVFLPFAMRWDYGIFQAMALLSALRLLNVGMPSFFDMTLYWLPFIYLPLIVVGMMMVKDELSGPRGWLTEFMFGEATDRGILRSVLVMTPIAVLLGYLSANIEYGILGNGPMIPELDLEWMLLLSVVMVLFIGFGEELMFRGILLRRTANGFGPVFAIILSSILFAMMHSGYGSVVYMAYVVFISLMLGVLYHTTRSLLFVTVYHGVINIFLFSLLPMGLWVL